jgi:LmbE family N-acetylglucosaminyl deacetylase
VRFFVFDSSALVVAHPDDEVLWFSSILSRVQRVIVCCEDCADVPELGAARRAARQAYPLSNVTWLARPEPCSVHLANWKHPVQTEYGMALNAPSAGVAGDDRYRSAYQTLRADLREALRGTANVFTHNPWGEYGHPDHVQVSRVVGSLRQELGFELRYTNYISPRSMAFAVAFLPRLASDLRLPTDPVLAARIKGVYRAYHAWTWDEDYEPPDEEAFLKESHAPPSERVAVPLNCLMTV